jgi:hypothetical protein
VVDIWQVEDARQLPNRRSKPSPDLTWSRRIRPPEHAKVRCHAAARRSFVGQDQKPSNDGGLPAESFEGNARCQAHLHVVTAQRFLDGRQLRLELNYEERSRPRVPSEQVDRSAFSEDRECDLRHDDPARVLEIAHHPGAQAGVSLIEQSVEVSSTPADDHNDICIERREESADGAERKPFDSTTLHEGDHRLR